MKIGILLPSIYSSDTYSKTIFAPKPLAVSLANGLVKRGHKVYLYSADNVKTKAYLVKGDNKLLVDNLINHKLRHSDEHREKWGTFYLKKYLFELDLTQKAYLDAKENKVDIIHSYHDTLAHFFDGITSIPVIYTLHDPLPPPYTIEYWLLDKFKNHYYVSISTSFRKKNPSLHFIATIYHGLDLNIYKFSSESDDHFLFMGRIVEEKGLPTAIKIILNLNLNLKIGIQSGKKDREGAYYTSSILPLLKEPNIQQIGFLDVNSKVEAYKRAKALLFPIEWEEPFGMVLIESMACGTPVVAFARGSVPEIVKDGETGFIVNSSDSDKRGDWVIKKTGIEGLTEAVKRIYSMPQNEYQSMRRNCRKHVEEKFTVEKMVDGYEQVYKKVLSNS